MRARPAFKALLSVTGSVGATPVSAGAFWFLVLGLASSCGAPRYDGDTLEGKAAILDEVNLALTDGDCTRAIAAIEPLYGSKATDNQVRLARASAHGCATGINFFKLIGDLGNNNLAGSGFWITMAKLFPGAPTDTKVESSWYATDALMATLKPGAVVSPAYQVGVGTPNVGSLFTRDREDDANLYMIFASMATIGGLENRYSAPDPTTFHKTHVLGYKATATLGWAKVANMDQEGCSYAGAILNMVDAIGAVGSQGSGALQNAFSSVTGGLSTAIDLACEAGCQGIALGGGVGSGCAGIPAGACNPCPRTLRDRNSCKNTANDLNGCAAAGIINFINSDGALGWP